MKTGAGSYSHLLEVADDVVLLTELPGDPVQHQSPRTHGVLLLRLHPQRHREFPHDENTFNRNKNNFSSDFES